MNKKGL